MNEYIIPFLINKEEPSEYEPEELSHWHQSFELIEIVEGEYRCHVSGKQFISKAGDLCIINRSQMHRLLKNSPNNCRKKVLIFDPDYFIHSPTIYQKYVQPLQEDNSFSHMQFHGNKGIGAEIKKLMNEIESLDKEKPDGYEIETTGLIYLIIRRLYLAFRQHEKTLQESIDPNRSIQRKMTMFIYENYADKLFLEDIADAGLVSKSTCIRLFKEYTGKSPIDFLNRYRLEMSAQLLRETKSPVTEIALQCGFAQASYFNRQFKKEYHLSPIQYRQQIKNEMS